MSDPRLDITNSIEIFSSVSERITQLNDLKTTLDEILAILKKVSGCRHIAIRIIDSKGNIPFYSHIGLEKALQKIRIKAVFTAVHGAGPGGKRIPRQDPGRAIGP